MLRILNPLSWFSSNKNFEETYTQNEELVEAIEFDIKFLERYIKLLTEDSVIEDFLHFDSCCVLADKYLLAITFAYFIRADLKPDQYTRFNFFSALYLAHAMEEDDYSLRTLIIPWSIGGTQAAKKALLIDNYTRLLRKIDYRALVSKANCEKVFQAIPNAKVWQRFRPEMHAGAYRSNKKCIRCYSSPKDGSDPFSTYKYEDDLYDTRPWKKLKFSDLIAEENTEELDESEQNTSYSFTNESFGELDEEELFNQVEEE